MNLCLLCAGAVGSVSSVVACGVEDFGLEQENLMLFLPESEFDDVKVWTVRIMS